FFTRSSQMEFAVLIFDQEYVLTWLKLAEWPQSVFTLSAKTAVVNAMRNNGTANILRKFISILLFKLLHLVCLQLALGHARHDAPPVSRGQLAALLTSGLRAGH